MSIRFLYAESWQLRFNKASRRRVQRSVRAFAQDVAELDKRLETLGRTFAAHAPAAPTFPERLIGHEIEINDDARYPAIPRQPC